MTTEIPERAVSIGCLHIADSGEVLVVDAIHQLDQPPTIRLAGSRLTPDEAAELAALLLSASSAAAHQRR